MPSSSASAHEGTIPATQSHLLSQKGLPLHLYTAALWISLSISYIILSRLRSHYSKKLSLTQSELDGLFQCSHNGPKTLTMLYSWLLTCLPQHIFVVGNGATLKVCKRESLRILALDRPICILPYRIPRWELLGSPPRLSESHLKCKVSILFLIS